MMWDLVREQDATARQGSGCHRARRCVVPHPHPCKRTARVDLGGSLTDLV